MSSEKLPDIARIPNIAGGPARQPCAEAWEACGTHGTRVLNSGGWSP